MNKDIRQLEDKIINVLNESQVPIEAKRLVLECIMHLAEKEADKIIREELANAESAQCEQE